MNNILDDLEDATLKSETTPAVPGYSGSCVAERPAGHNTGLGHVGARILSTQQIEAWRDPGYYIS
jgi:hypothetical protein